MRRTFVTALAELAESEPRVVLLTADLGFGMIEPFADRFPDRFYNVGVAEQNLIGIATGLAEAGLLPFTYSIVTFATLRPYEFIRNGPVHQRLPVRIVGVGGGVEYGMNGPTHHGLEDVAVMRALPGMTIVTPADHRQARACLPATATLDGPVYYRLGKDETREVAGIDGSFELGRLDVAEGGGEDVAIVALGPIATQATAAAELLAEHGIGATVAVVASVSPPPADDLERLLESFPLVVTVEAHRPVGGVGSLVAEVAAGLGAGARVVRLGIESLDEELVGSEAYLLERHGLSGERIADRVIHELSGGRSSARMRAHG